MTAATFRIRRLIGRLLPLWDGLSDGAATSLYVLAGIAAARFVAWLGREAYAELTDAHRDR